ncbi:MAG: ribosome silencing factor [Candidatus Omnitrophica bacterium]|nr:ribosome silencing factor [Candidatus Omnitrophota bacterium]
MTSRSKALRIAQAALDEKADALTVLDLRKLSSSFDYFILCNATSQRRAQAIADAVEEALRPSGARLWHQEGYAEGGWLLLDYGSVVLHIFDAESRTFYQLERLWYDAPRLAIPSGNGVSPRRVSAAHAKP